MDPLRNNPVSSGNPSNVNPGTISSPPNNINNPNNLNNPNNPNFAPGNPFNNATNGVPNYPVSNMPRQSRYNAPQWTPMDMGISNTVPVDNRRKKAKVWNVGLIILIAVILCLIVGFLFLQSSYTNTSEISEFHEILVENDNNLSDFLLFVDSVYSGEVSLQNYYEQSSEKDVDWLDGGFNSLIRLNNRLDNGSVLNGVHQLIDLKSNYLELRDELDNTMDGYERFTELTKTLLELSGEDHMTVINRLSDSGLQELVLIIEEYDNGLKIIEEGYVDGECADEESAGCMQLIEKYGELRKLLEDTDIVRRAYISAGGNLDINSNRLIISYIDNLRVGTSGVEDE